MHGRIATLIAGALLAGCLASASRAQPAPESAAAKAVRLAAEDFLRTQTRGLGADVSYVVLPLDPRTSLAPCAPLDVYVPPGSRLWGRTTLGVRCNAPNGWSIFVGADVRVRGEYLVAARAIPAGQPVSESDLATRTGDLTQVPQGVLSDPRQVVGKLAAGQIAPGETLRPDLLRAPLAVQQGQLVRLLTRGNGFQISAEGRALNNAQDGQVAQVRTAAGQTVSGIARTGGTVDVGFQ